MKYEETINWIKSFNLNVRICPSEIEHSCNIYKLVSNKNSTGFEKIDVLSLNESTFEYGRAVKGFDNVGVQVKQSFFNRGE